jgi:hypothetical protein
VAAKGQSYQVDGQSIRIPPGSYLIGGAVNTVNFPVTVTTYEPLGLSMTTPSSGLMVGVVSKGE